MEEVHKRALQDILKNAPNPHPKITNADNQRRLHTTRTRPKPLQALAEVVTRGIILVLYRYYPVDFTEFLISEFAFY